MKLSEPFKLESTESGGFYARSLRAIGQDLTDLYPEKLEIERRGEDFVVRGLCAKGRLEAEQPRPGRTSLKELLAQDIANWSSESKSTSVSFARTYNSEDIARLDEAGSRHRAGTEKLPDIRSLGELLRTVGKLIEAEEGRLIKIVKDTRQITFEYVNRDGKTCRQEMSSFDLHKLQQRYYEKRSEPKAPGPWKLRK